MSGVATARRRARFAARGLTLVEVLVATAVLAFIATLIFGAFSGMRRSKEGIERLTDRYREGRLAMSRMTRELQSAYLSAHQPIDPNLSVMQTVFVGERHSPADRIDFTSFAHRRLRRDVPESDQAEISYFASEDPERAAVLDLVRREDPSIDLEPQKGGRIDVLATDIDLFRIDYLEPLTGQWLEDWDSTQATGQLNRLPPQVKLSLVLNGGRRAGAGRGRERISLVTKVAIPIHNALRFATQ